MTVIAEKRVNWTSMPFSRVRAKLGSPRATALVLRWSLGIVYLWFGTLKAASRSPALLLIHDFFPPLSQVPLICALTGFEVALGILLVIGWPRPWIYYAALLHLLGTFLVLLVSPGLAFSPFPFLTLDGEFIVKNLVLIAAAFALLQFWRRGEDAPQLRLRRRTLRLAGLLLMAIFSATPSHANGHGPVFGVATPTNAKGGWELDTMAGARVGADKSGVMSRIMLTYGVTDRFQLSFTAPYVFSFAPLAPTRGMGMMTVSPDFEGIAAWRFFRRGADVGTRFESTAYGGLIIPGAQRARGPLGPLNRAPGVYTAIATGMASRSHYVWVGVQNAHFAEAGGDQRPNIFTYSAVWGYRPRPFRKEYPHWDWRFFLEMAGDVSNKFLQRGLRVPGTGGHQIFLGPTVLGIHKNFALSGGVQFPVFRDIGVNFQREKAHIVVNLSWFF